MNRVLKNNEDEFLKSQNIGYFDTDKIRYYVMKIGRKKIITPDMRLKIDGDSGLWRIIRNPETRKFTLFEPSKGFSENRVYSREIDETIEKIIKEDEE